MAERTLDLGQLQGLLERVRGLKIACVGDLMLDRYVYGEVSRISPEAPIPVLQQRRTTAMPGGVGTFEEFFEAITWTQLGLHRKACGLLNVAGFYTPLATFIDQAVTEGFIKPVHRAAIVVDDDPVRLLDTLSTLELPNVVKWLRPDET